MRYDPEACFVHEFCFLLYRPPHFKINYCTLFSSASGKGKPVEKLKIDRKDDEEDEESEYEEDEDEYETEEDETEE